MIKVGDIASPTVGANDVRGQDVRAQPKRVDCANAMAEDDAVVLTDAQERVKAKICVGPMGAGNDVIFPPARKASSAEAIVFIIIASCVLKLIIICSSQ